MWPATASLSSLPDPMRLRPILCASLLAALALPLRAGDWQDKIRDEMPLLGHRNWIVIVDSAYPWQNSPGIETVETHASLPDVLRDVLVVVGHDQHVRANVFTDAELSEVPEADAPGIGAYRAELARILAGRAVGAVPHEELIARLDEAGKTFHVLLLKTTLTLPYTSVFLQLDCAYWPAAAEQRLRAEEAKERLRAAKP